MNDQSVGYEPTISGAAQPIRQVDSSFLHPRGEAESVESQSRSSSMNHSIVLGQKDKEAFIEMVNRPAQVNQKLFAVFSKVI
jgi:hypothetical protein